MYVCIYMRTLQLLYKYTLTHVLCLSVVQKTCTALLQLDLQCPTDNTSNYNKLNSTPSSSKVDSFKSILLL